VRGTRATVDGLANGFAAEDTDITAPMGSLTRSEGPLWKRWIKNLQP